MYDAGMNRKLFLLFVWWATLCFYRSISSAKLFGSFNVWMCVFTHINTHTHSNFVFRWLKTIKSEWKLIYEIEKHVSATLIWTFLPLHINSICNYFSVDLFSYTMEIAGSDFDLTNEKKINNFICLASYESTRCAPAGINGTKLTTMTAMMTASKNTTWHHHILCVRAESSSYWFSLSLPLSHDTAQHIYIFKSAYICINRKMAELQINYTTVAC